MNDYEQGMYDERQRILAMLEGEKFEMVRASYDWNDAIDLVIDLIRGE